MIALKFDPWNEIIKIVSERWPELKADIYFTNTEWDWASFPVGTVWYPQDSDTALIRISNSVPFMETLDILTKSLSYLAHSHVSGKILDMMGEDKDAEIYANWIYDEYTKRITERDRLHCEAAAREEEADAAYGCEPTKNIA